MTEGNRNIRVSMENYNRLSKLVIDKKDTFNDIIGRLLDFTDSVTVDGITPSHIVRKDRRQPLKLAGKDEMDKVGA
jgi:hypothetical protein